MSKDSYNSAQPITYRKRVTAFGIVGIFNTVLNVAVFNALIVFFGADAAFANLVSIIVSIIVAFILSRSIVFKDRSSTSNSIRSQFVRFTTVNIFTLFVVHQAVLIIFAYKLTMIGSAIYAGISEMMSFTFLSEQFVVLNTAKIIAVAASMAAGYILYDRFVFKEK